jgi:hypothetical protein
MHAAICENLQARREVMNRTAEYLRIERLAVERNAPWMEPQAYRRRIQLLDSLAAWYDEERAKLNQARKLPEKTDLPQPA